MVRTTVMRRSILIAFASGIAWTSAAGAGARTAREVLAPAAPVQHEAQSEILALLASAWARLSGLWSTLETEDGSSMDPFGRL
jgi:hypothetical protein